MNVLLYIDNRILFFIKMRYHQIDMSVNLTLKILKAINNGHF